MNRVINAISSVPAIAPLAKRIGNHVDLKPNGIKIMLDISVTEHRPHQQWPIFSKEHGRIIQKGHQKSESFVTNFLRYLAYAASNSTLSQTIVDTTGTTSGNLSALLFNCNGAANSNTTGIRAGTGVGTPATTDYELGTIIAHGTSSGQLQYQAGVVAAPTVSSNTVTFTITRQLVNGSAGTITITEVGVAAGMTASTGKNVLIIRDKLTNSYAVTSGNSVTITYTISTTT